MGEIESQLLHELVAGLALRLDRERPGRAQRRRTLGLARERVLDQVRGEFRRAWRTADRSRRRGRRARTHRAAPRRARRRACAALAGRSGAPDRARFAARAARGEIIRRPRLAPGHLASRAGARRRLDEIGRHRRGMEPFAAHFPEIGALPGIEPGFGLRGGEQIGQIRAGQQLVADHVKRGLLFGARGGAPFGHHGVGVPAQESRGLLQQAEAAEAGFQGAIGMVDHGGS